MGWSSGGEVFEPVAIWVLVEVRRGLMSRTSAVEVLGVLARALLERGWDTVDDMPAVILSDSVVRDALRDADWLID